MVENAASNKSFNTSTNGRAQARFQQRKKRLCIVVRPEVRIPAGAYGGLLGCRIAGDCLQRVHFFQRQVRADSVKRLYPLLGMEQYKGSSLTVICRWADLLNAPKIGQSNIAVAAESLKGTCVAGWT